MSTTNADEPKRSHPLQYGPTRSPCSSCVSSCFGLLEPLSRGSARLFLSLLSRKRIHTRVPGLNIGIHLHRPHCCSRLRFGGERQGQLLCPACGTKRRLSHSPGLNREVQAAIIVPFALLSPRGLHLSALRSDCATLPQATHSDSDRPGGRPKAAGRRLPLAGWF